MGRKYTPGNEDIYREYLTQINLLDCSGALRREALRQRRRERLRRYVRRLLWGAGLLTALWLLK